MGSMNVGEENRIFVEQKMCQFFSKKDAKKVELGIHDFTEQYCGDDPIHLSMAQKIYLDIFNNLIYNFEDKDNVTGQKIIKDASKNNYNTYNLAFLRPDELNYDKWKKIIQKRNTSEERLNNLPTIEWKPCRNCKNNKYFHRQEQTRSADEPMTVFYTCKRCKAVYKFN